jgi:hypothetical protein
VKKSRFLEMWNEIREAFDVIIKKYDSLWMKRERNINTRFLILFILRLTIPKDERGYGNTLLEIFSNFFNFEIDGITKSLAPSSICEARMKLDPNIFKELNNNIIDIWNRYNEMPLLWHGLLLRGVDGSKLTLPKELLRAGYETPGDHAYYPQGLLSGVYDLLSGIPLDFDFVHHNNERICALEHLKQAEQYSLNIYDRGYFSFELLADHIKYDINAVFRLQSNTKYTEIHEFWESEETDKIILLHPPRRILQDVKKGLFNIKLDPICVRLIKYTIEKNIYVLLTTLTDQDKYPENIFPEVYHSRWGHEEMLKVSKVITGVKDFHSTSEIGIKQELFAHFIIITLLKIVQSQSHFEVKEEKKIKENEPPKRRIIPLKKKIFDNLAETTIPDIDNFTLLKEIDFVGKQTLRVGADTIFNNNEVIDLAMQITKKDQSIFQSDSEKSDFKINQRGCFLVVGMILEKLLYWSPIKFVQESIIPMLDWTKKLYQKLRPGRNNTRTSRSAPSKWCYKGKQVCATKA